MARKGDKGKGAGRDKAEKAKSLSESGAFTCECPSRGHRMFGRRGRDVSAQPPGWFWGRWAANARITERSSAGQRRCAIRLRMSAI